MTINNRDFDDMYAIKWPSDLRTRLDEIKKSYDNLGKDLFKPTQKYLNILESTIKAFPLKCDGFMRIDGGASGTLMEDCSA
ncbi:MAG: hypothetical protein K6B51_04365 [Bacilli bacterium]|nr:hypothetical protein [Bacilli bacterium]